MSALATLLRPSAPRDAACYALAVLACLWVLAANGGALFYYDTGSFLERGQQMLAQLGVAPEAGPAPMRGDLGDAQAPFPEEGPRTLDGSRSAIYSLLVGLFARAGALEGLLVLQAVLAVTALWLPARLGLRAAGTGRRAAPLVLAATLVASLGSLSFYASYLMPDILAPVLILMAASFAAFAGIMRPWEAALALALAALAVVSHLSHLAIAGLLLPLVALVTWAAPRGRRWLAPLLMLAVVALGFGEREAFRIAADVTQDAEVVYRPFLTARLIQDGPGLRYLDETCPDAAVPTCALAEALSWSDDPYRLTATHIVFEDSPRLGSFRLMAPQDQRDVAAAQFDFALDVARDRPLDVLLAVARNTLRQVRNASIDMTLPDDKVVGRLAGLPGLALGPFAHGRLTADRGWEAAAVPLQAGLYALSALAILALLLAPAVPRRVKLLAVMVGLGILVNAFVCGALSQPAARYGGRVIWLLPATAVLAAGFLRRPEARPAAVPPSGRRVTP